MLGLNISKYSIRWTLVSVICMTTLVLAEGDKYKPKVSYDTNPPPLPSQINKQTYNPKPSNPTNPQEEDSEQSAPAPSTSDYGKGPSGKVKFTYYWIAIEGDAPQNRASATISSCSGKPIKQVSSDYYEKVKMEGSGLLSTGQFINCGNSDCTCFELTDGAKGSQNNPLAPYISIAANDITIGTKLVVKELVGIKLPNGAGTHNGCVRVDDKSWSFGSDHIDWYVFDIKNYDNLDAQIKLNSASVTKDANCQLLTYQAGSNVTPTTSTSISSTAVSSVVTSSTPTSYMNLTTTPTPTSITAPTYVNPNQPYQVSNPYQLGPTFSYPSTKPTASVLPTPFQYPNQPDPGNSPFQSYKPYVYSSTRPYSNSYNYQEY